MYSTPVLPPRNNTKSLEMYAFSTSNNFSAANIWNLLHPSDSTQNNTKDPHHAPLLQKSFAMSLFCHRHRMGVTQSRSMVHHQLRIRVRAGNVLQFPLKGHPGDSPTLLLGTRRRPRRCEKSCIGGSDTPLGPSARPPTVWSQVEP